MDENIYNNTPVEEDGIDYKAILLRFWTKRKFIVTIFTAFVILGFFVALFQKPVFTSSCTFVPLSNSKGASSSMSSLAALAGISLGDMTSNANLSPLVYPKLLQNVELNKDLMRVPIKYKKYDEPVSLYALRTDPKYKKFNLGATIKKYTIGLPFLIIGAITGKSNEVVVSEGTEQSKVSFYDKDEYECSKALAKILSLNVEKKDGYLTLTAKMDDSYAAAQMCQAAFDLLQKYVTEFKLRAARESYNYILARYNEAKSEYETKQHTLAQFVDSNRGILTATAQTRRDQLMSEYNVASAMYNELAKQLLQSEMKMKEDTEVLSPIEPTSVPMKKSNSRMKTLFIWVFLGVIVSLGLVLGLDWLKKNNVAYPFAKPARLKSFYEGWE